MAKRKLTPVLIRPGTAPVFPGTDHPAVVAKAVKSEIEARQRRGAMLAQLDDVTVRLTRVGPTLEALGSSDIDRDALRGSMLLVAEHVRRLADELVEMYGRQEQLEREVRS